MRLALVAAAALALAGCSAAPEQSARFVLIEDTLVVMSPDPIEATLGPHCANVTYELDPPSLVYRTSDRSELLAPKLMVVRRYVAEGPIMTTSADRTDLYADAPILRLLSPVDRTLMLTDLSIDDASVDVGGYAAGTAGATIEREYSVGNASVRETLFVRDLRTVPVRVEHVGLCA